MSERFPASRRILKRADFVRIQKSGGRVNTPHFLLLVAPQPDGASPGAARLGLVASRKVGNAVERNRAKRLLREAFRRNPTLFPDGVDLVVVLRAGAHDLAIEDVVAELDRASAKLARRAAEVRR